MKEQLIVFEKSNWLELLLSMVAFVGSLIGFTLLYWLVFPLIFTPDVMSWVFFVSFTVLNGIAILLSYIYFDTTHCIENEGNFIAMIGYFVYGYRITHILLVIARIISNIFYYFSVFGADFVLFGIPYLTLPQETLFLAIPVAIFATEMVFNIHAIVVHGDERCKIHQPMFCDCVGQDGCWCEIK